MEQKTIKLLKNIISDSDNYSESEKRELNNALKVINGFNTDLNKDAEMSRLIKNGLQFIKNTDNMSTTDKYLDEYGLNQDSTVEEIEKRKKSILNYIANNYENTKYIDKAHRYQNEYILISDRFDKLIEAKKNGYTHLSMSSANSSDDYRVAAADCKDTLYKYANFIEFFAKYSIDTDAKNEINDIKEEAFAYAYEDMSNDEIDDSKNANVNMPAESVTIQKDYAVPVEYLPNSYIRKPRERGKFETDEAYNAFITQYFNRYKKDVPAEWEANDKSTFYGDKLEYVIEQIHDYFRTIKYAFADLRWLYNRCLAINNKIKGDLKFYKKQNDVEDKDSLNKIIKELETKQKAVKQFISDYEDKLDVLNSINREVYGEADLTGDIYLSVELTEDKDQVKANLSIYDDENRNKYVNASYNEDGELDVSDDYIIDKNSIINIEIEKMLDDFVNETIEEKDLDLDLDTVKNSNIEIISNGKSYVIPYEYANEMITKMIKVGLDKFSKTDAPNVKKVIKTRSRKKTTQESKKEDEIVVDSIVADHVNNEQLINNQDNTIEEALDNALVENADELDNANLNEVIEQPIVEEVIQETNTEENKDELKPIAEDEEILEYETEADAFKRITGKDFDPNKYEIRQGEGSYDDGYDNPINTISIYEKADKEESVQDYQEEVSEPIVEKEYPQWDSRLTDEQILDALSRDIYEPVGPEYEQFLNEVGLGELSRSDATPDDEIVQPIIEENVEDINQYEEIPEDVNNEEELTDTPAIEDIPEDVPVEEELTSNNEVIEEIPEDIVVDEEISQDNENVENIPEDTKQEETIEESTEIPEVIPEDTATEENIEMPTVIDTTSKTTEQENKDTNIEDNKLVEEEQTELSPIESVDEVFNKNTDERTNEETTDEVKNEDNQVDNRSTTIFPTSDDNIQEDKENVSDKKEYKVVASRLPRNLGKTLAATVIGAVSTLFGALPAVAFGGTAVISIINMNVDNVFRAIQKHKLKKIARRNNVKFYFLSNDKIEVRDLDGKELTEEQINKLQLEIDEKINKKKGREGLPDVTIDSISNAFIIEDEPINYYVSSRSDDKKWEELIKPTHTIDEVVNSTEEDLSKEEAESLVNEISKDNEQTYIDDEEFVSKVDIKGLINQIYDLNPNLDSGAIKQDKDGVYYVEVEKPEELVLPEGFEYIKGIGIRNSQNKDFPDFVIDVVKKQPESKSMESQLASEVSDARIDEIVDTYGKLLTTEDCIDRILKITSAYSRQELEAARDNYLSLQKSL